jgi:hypothetical protein
MSSSIDHTTIQVERPMVPELLDAVDATQLTMQVQFSKREKERKREDKISLNWFLKIQYDYLN